MAVKLCRRATNTRRCAHACIGRVAAAEHSTWTRGGRAPPPPPPPELAPLRWCRVDQLRDPENTQRKAMQTFIDSAPIRESCDQLSRLLGSLQDSSKAAFEAVDNTSPSDAEWSCLPSDAMGTLQRLAGAVAEARRALVESENDVDDLIKLCEHESEVKVDLFTGRVLTQKDWLLPRSGAGEHMKSKFGEVRLSKLQVMRWSELGRTLRSRMTS